LFALKPLSENIYDEYLATILERSRGTILKVPLDVAQDINLPAIVANNQKEEKLAQNVENRAELFTPKRPIQELKSPPRIQRQESFFVEDSDEEKPRKPTPKSEFKSPPKVRRSISPPTISSPKQILEKARENYLRDQPLSYAKQLGEKSIKPPVQTASLPPVYGPPTADDALALDFSRLRI
jgi:hypothetical protein